MTKDIVLSYRTASAVVDSFILILNWESKVNRRDAEIYQLEEDTALELFQALAQALAKPLAPPPPSAIQVEQERSGVTEPV